MHERPIGGFSVGPGSKPPAENAGNGCQIEWRRRKMCKTETSGFLGVSVIIAVLENVFWSYESATSSISQKHWSTISKNHSYHPPGHSEPNCRGKSARQEIRGHVDRPASSAPLCSPSMTSHVGAWSAGHAGWLFHGNGKTRASSKNPDEKCRVPHVTDFSQP